MSGIIKFTGGVGKTNGGGNDKTGVTRFGKSNTATQSIMNRIDKRKIFLEELSKKPLGIISGIDMTASTTNYGSLFKTHVKEIYKALSAEYSTLKQSFGVFDGCGQTIFKSENIQDNINSLQNSNNIGGSNNVGSFILQGMNHLGSIGCGNKVVTVFCDGRESEPKATLELIERMKSEHARLFFVLDGDSHAYGATYIKDNIVNPLGELGVLIQGSSGSSQLIISLISSMVQYTIQSNNPTNQSQISFKRFLHQKNNQLLLDDSNIIQGGY